MNDHACKALNGYSTEAEMEKQNEGIVGMVRHVDKMLRHILRETMLKSNLRVVAM